MSERRGARSEKEQQQYELEAAGWELVERGSGKTIWRNPQSGGLYPQSVAITMVREVPSPRIADEEPGTGCEKNRHVLVSTFAVFSLRGGVAGRPRAGAVAK